MKLIDKNKLLEELKKLKQNLSVSPIVVIEDVEFLIESLEVKEVDELTVDDVMRIDAILINDYNDSHNGKFSYEDVLRKFNEQKGEQLYTPK